MKQRPPAALEPTRMLGGPGAGEGLWRGRGAAQSPVGSGTFGKDGFQLRESGDGWKANICFHLDTDWFEALRVQNGGPENEQGPLL